MTASKTSGLQAKTDDVPNTAATRRTKKMVAQKRLGGTVSTGQGGNAFISYTLPVNYEVLVSSIDFSDFKPISKVRPNVIENNDTDLTEEELDIAREAVRLSASDGLSSGEDHVARIKYILSVG